jgi:hypothetical protein
MPGVCQVRATGRHRMPLSVVPHKTSAQLQWYYFIYAFSYSSDLPRITDRIMYCTRK